ncbi:MAG: hypothetical protein ACRDZ3_22900 [Acidimicrobiia bacterium]
MIDWLFRSRETGRITIAQFPNPALWVFIVASVVRRVLDPNGRVDGTLRVVATGALFWWAADEVVRGVNPWRRILGAGVLAAQLLNILTR